MQPKALELTMSRHMNVFDLERVLQRVLTAESSIQAMTSTPPVKSMEARVKSQFDSSVGPAEYLFEAQITTQDSLSNRTCPVSHCVQLSQCGLLEPKQC